MKILCDENIPRAHRVFSSLGQTTLVPGRHIDRDMVRDVDALLVRSVTKVNADLLEGSSVRFVASATIGVDHIDREYLQRRDIAFAYAPGSNADSVAQYVTAALAWYARSSGWHPSGKTIAVVGVGNVGSRVVRLTRALGMHPLLNDPPRARREGGAGFCSLEEALGEADVVTVHVPLICTGMDATDRMVDETFLERLKPGAVFLNTSRGRVVNEAALQRARGRLGGVILDVFNDEPSPSPDTLRACLLATPHIAGYSHDGKLRGTQAIYEALCRFAGRPPELDLNAEMASVVQNLQTPERAMDVFETILAAYPIHADHERLLPIRTLPTSQRGPFFDTLRKEYPVRLEFSHFRVPPAHANLDTLKALGFGTDTAPTVCS